MLFLSLSFAAVGALQLPILPKAASSLSSSNDTISTLDQGTLLKLCGDTSYEGYCETFDLSPLGTCYGVPDPWVKSLFSAITSDGLTCEFYPERSCDGAGLVCTACIDWRGFENMTDVPEVKAGRCTATGRDGCKTRNCTFSEFK
ncbi:hypothetical protein BT69DRAFT_1335227 [Atractiella rhizophila]|nr:hypothetical protein BT69DRAFT_1335227 [Atractiella rhizophila]